jgi:CyaY protein
MTTSADMDEKTFADLTDQVMKRVLGALDAQDPDVVEAALDAGVVKISFRSGNPYVLNTQRPVREVWLAAELRAWHFRYDGARWIDPKSGDELYARLTELLRTKTGLPLSL